MSLVEKIGLGGGEGLVDWKIEVETDLKESLYCGV